MLLPLLLALLVAQQAPKPAPKEADDPGPPVVKRGPNAPRKSPAEAGKAPNILNPLPPKSDDDNEVPKADRPVLRKGVSVGEKSEAKEKEEEPEDEATPGSKRLIRYARKSTDDLLIDRAFQAALEFDETLPNFICDEIVKRFKSSAKPPKWKLDDTVETELLYVNRQEEYRNVRINGKPLKSGRPEETGNWSSGDWGTTLKDVLSPATDGAFKLRTGKDKIAGVETVIYDYTVEAANSHWEIRFGTPIKPAYKGAIWIDPETARVMRIEMQARRIPQTYEMDTVEMTIEYGWVNVSGDKYLLPVTSQNLGCFRYTTKCGMNELAFKNYRKFGAESTIITTESNISFGGEEKAPASKTAPPELPPAKKKQ